MAKTRSIVMVRVMGELGSVRGCEKEERKKRLGLGSINKG